MKILEMTLASHAMAHEQVPERFATVKRHPSDDYIKVVFVDANSVKDHYVLADCLEDVESMADLMQNKLGGTQDEYVKILNYFMK